MNKKGRLIIALRKKGKTYGEIEKALKVPKSTIAWWLKDVKIPKTTQDKILEKSRKKWKKNITSYNKIYAKLRSQEAKEKREKIENETSKEIKNLSKKDIQLIGCALYWAEGNKKNKWNLRFANSDPAIIKIIMRFFQEICALPKEKIKARIHLYPEINHLKALNYWKKITSLPGNNFQKSQIQISKASKGKRPRNTLPYGTLHLTAGNTKITCKVKGWIKGISNKT